MVPSSRSWPDNRENCKQIQIIKHFRTSRSAYHVGYSQEISCGKNGLHPTFDSETDDIEKKTFAIDDMGKAVRKRIPFFQFCWKF